MKILLTTNLPYFPTHGGANTSNRFLLEGFVKNKHSVVIVVPALGTPSQLTHAQWLEEVKSQGFSVTSEAGVEIFNLNGVEVHAVVEQSGLRKHLIEQIRRFNPDWTLVSSEDPSQNLLDAALKHCPGRVVYLARTAPFLPFGPNAFFPSQTRTKMLGKAAAIMAVSEYVADYIRQWGGLESVVLPISFYGDGPFPNHGCFDKGYITMINPCAVKGLSIFVACARALPDVPFAAVPTWGTTEENLNTLRHVPNIHLLKPTENVDEIYSESRIILVPSLVAEGKSRVILEAMLRGIPVLASDCGGNVEAKLDKDFLLPVHPIRAFGEQLDGRMLPIPMIPEQDIGPWLNALRGLLSDRDFYDRVSSAGREVALKFVASMDIAALQNFLLNLEPKPQASDGASREADVTHIQSIFVLSNGTGASLADLSPEQKALLTLRLRKKAATRSEVFA
jgi:glycosyltransferase involved in cell wall biosynthesis